MGLLQHHDAVSGTEKQHVADDYAQRLSDGIDQAIVGFHIQSVFSNGNLFFRKLSTMPMQNFCLNKVKHQYLHNSFVH